MLKTPLNTQCTPNRSMRQINGQHITSSFLELWLFCASGRIIGCLRIPKTPRRKQDAGRLVSGTLVGLILWLLLRRCETRSRNKRQPIQAEQHGSRSYPGPMQCPISQIHTPMLVSPSMKLLSRQGFRPSTLDDHYLSIALRVEVCDDWPKTQKASKTPNNNITTNKINDCINSVCSSVCVE